MPNWTFLLVIGFITLGLRQRPTLNVHAVAIGMTVLVLLFAAVKGHLIPT